MNGTMVVGELKENVVEDEASLAERQNSLQLHNIIPNDPAKVSKVTLVPGVKDSTFETALNKNVFCYSTSTGVLRFYDL